MRRQASHRFLVLGEESDFLGGELNAYRIDGDATALDFDHVTGSVLVTQNPEPVFIIAVQLLYASTSFHL